MKELLFLNLKLLWNENPFYFHIFTENKSQKRSKAKHPRKLFILFFLSLFTNISSAQPWTQVHQDIDGTQINGQFGTKTAISGDGSIVAISAPYENNSGSNKGQVRIYHVVNNTWTQIGNTIVGANANDRFGSSLDISKNGTRVAIGSFLNSDNGAQSGHVKVFDWNGNNWMQAGATITGDNNQDFLGFSVALSDSGNTLAIGATRTDVNNNNSGQVQIYNWTGNSWSQTGSAINGTTTDLFGNSVALSADGLTVVIGERNTNRVKVYQYVGTNWSQMGNDLVGIIPGVNPIRNFGFGTDVAINSNGTIIAVGAPNNSNQNDNPYGFIRSLMWNGTSWMQVGQDVIGSIYSERFGQSVSISADGKRILGSSSGFGANQGFAAVHDFDGNNWNQVGPTLFGETTSDQFGRSSAISCDGKKLIVGASANVTSNGLKAGQARVFLDDKLQITCPNINEIGAFSCTEDLPEEPEVMVDRDTDAITVDNDFGNYGIVVTGEPEGQLMVFFSDNIEVNFCNDQTITRTITVFDDLDESDNEPGNRLLDDDEDFQICTFTYFIDEVAAPTITCPDAVTIACGSSLDPSTNNNLGIATATNNCAPNGLLKKDSVLINYLDNSWKYFLKPKDSNCGTNGEEAIAFDDSAWPTGGGGFTDVPNNLTCGAMLQGLTTYPVNSNIIIRQKVNLPVGSKNLKVKVAFDNGTKVFVNGQAVSDCLDSDGCAVTDRAIINVDDNLLVNGENVIVVLGTDRGGSSYLDVEVLADIPTDPTFSYVDVITPGMNEFNYSVIRTWTATDACGNTAACDQLITVRDNSDPIATCKDITVELDGSGAFTLDPSLLNNGSNDNCSTPDKLTFLASKTIFNCNDVKNPNLEVTLKVIDESGNSSTCTSTVKVEDNLAPEITTPGDITITMDSGNCEQVINFSVSALDNCTGNIIPVLESGSATILSGGVFTPGEYLYNYSAQDNCANKSTKSFTITVKEAELNSLSCQTKITISLDANCKKEVKPADVLSGSFGCLNNFSVALFHNEMLTNPFVGSPNVGVNELGTTLYAQVTNTVTNNSCGPIEVKFKDGSIPNLKCQTEMNISCGADITPKVNGPLGFPFETNVTVTGPVDNKYTVSGFDACSDVTLTYFDIYQDIPCSAGGAIAQTVIRTWTATDAAMNSTTCEQTINLKRIALNDVVFPFNYTAEGGTPVVGDPVLPALHCDKKMPNSTSACGNVLGWNAIQPGDYPGDLYVGHPSPMNVLYSCGNVKWSGTGLPSGLNCGNISFTFQDLRTPIGAGGKCYKLNRTWTVIEACSGTSRTSVQQILVVDTEVPKFSGIQDLTISTNSFDCTGTYTVPVPQISDNCSNLITEYTVTTSTGNAVLNTSLNQFVISNLQVDTKHKIYLLATDDCGNEAKDSFFITVEDQVVPSVVCESFVTTSLTGDGVSKIFATTFDEGSFDECHPVYFKVLRMDQLNGTANGSVADQSGLRCQGFNGNDDVIAGNQIYFDDFVYACCEDLDKNVMVILRVFDRNPGTGPVTPNRMANGGNLFGHFNDCMVTLNINDKMAPTIEAPTDLTISCDYSYDLQALSNPDDDTFGKIVRSTSSNISTRANIILQDRWCDANINNAQNMGSVQFNPLNPTQTFQKNVGLDGMVYDNCQSNIAVSIVLENNLSCGQGILKRVFTATDAAGRKSTSEQRITVVNCSPFNITDTNCQDADPKDGVKWPCDFTSTTCGQGTLPSVTGMPILLDGGSCDLLSMTYNDQMFSVVNGACFQIVRTWTVTDWCQMTAGTNSGTWNYIQHIKVMNTTAPELTNFALGGVVFDANCVAEQELLIKLTDDCTPENLLIVDFKFDKNNNGQFDFIGSNKLPYPYPNPMMLPIIPVTYVDNMDGSFTASVKIPGLAHSTTHRIMWGAEDQCSNLGSLNSEFSIANNCQIISTAIIAGEIMTEDNEPACHIPVELMAGGGMSDQIETNEEGDFELEGIIGQNYAVVPEKLDEIRKGVSTLDLVLISRHLIGLQPLNSPYKLIAADVNKDNNIDAFDLIDLQKVILYLLDEFPNNKSYRFVDANYDFGNNSPLNVSFPEQVDINGLGVNEVANFIALKTGDVDGSVDMGMIATAGNRSSKVLNFKIEDQMVTAGETYTLEFQTEAYHHLWGYQFTLDFDESALEFVEAQGAKTEVHFGTNHADQGVLTLSYGHLEIQSFKDGTVAFKVIFEAQKNGLLSEMIQVNTTQYTSAEAYDENLEVLDVALDFLNSNSANFELFQNQPNPFKENTEIGFVLPKASSARITIFDISGQEVRSFAGDFSKGYNKVSVNITDLSSTGVFYYRLEFPTGSKDETYFSATKKMIVIQ